MKTLVLSEDACRALTQDKALHCARGLIRRPGRGRWRKSGIAVLAFLIQEQAGLSSSNGCDGCYGLRAVNSWLEPLGTSTCVSQTAETSSTSLLSQILCGFMFVPAEMTFKGKLGIH